MRKKVPIYNNFLKFLKRYKVKPKNILADVRENY